MEEKSTEKMSKIEEKLASGQISEEEARDVEEINNEVAKEAKKAEEKKQEDN